MRAPGMNVDAARGMGPLREHAGNQRNTELVQLVGNAMNGQGPNAGIAEDDLIDRASRGIAVQGRLDVEAQRGADLRHARHQRSHGACGATLQIDSIRLSLLGHVAVKRRHHLPIEQRADADDETSQVIRQVGLRQVARSLEAGK